MITRQTELSRRWCTALHGLRWESPILPRLVRYPSYLSNRFVMRSSGRIPFEKLTISKFQSPLLYFAEAVLAKESGIQEGKMGSL